MVQENHIYMFPDRLRSEMRGAPLALCSSTVSPPPENACRLILFLIWAAVSVTKMALVGSLALIFPVSPCKWARHYSLLNPPSRAIVLSPYQRSAFGAAHVHELAPAFTAAHRCGRARLEGREEARL